VDLIGVREDIRAALADGRPVVALKSSVIAHGLPSPVNVRVAHSLEDAVRVAGAIPATVGVIAGRVQVGLELAAVTEILGARTLAANHALLLNNARVAASIATTLCELRSASTFLNGH